MAIKAIEKNGRSWAWPAHDKKLLQVFDYVADIDYIMQFVDKTGLCIQAGGACGVWPIRFSELFDEVVTFEPHPENYRCLIYNKMNTKGDITPINAALSDREGKISIQVDDSEANNCGAYYLKPGDDVPRETLDSLNVIPDLIQLDVEGHEHAVLVGATKTLESRPVIVIEEKPLPHINDHLAARRLLEGLGYKQVGAIHRDVIFKC